MTVAELDFENITKVTLISWVNPTNLYDRRIQYEVHIECTKFDSKPFLVGVYHSHDEAMCVYEYWRQKQEESEEARRSEYDAE